MQTHGEMEAAIARIMGRFQQEHFGRGPKDIRAHLLGNLLVVRLTGVLTPAEQHLAATQSDDRGRDLLKQVRTHLVEASRGALEALIVNVTGVGIITFHHDLSTVAGEEVFVFGLAAAPLCREAGPR